MEDTFKEYQQWSDEVVVGTSLPDYDVCTNMTVLLQSFFQDFAQEGQNDVMEYRGGQSGMILKGCYCAKHNQHAMLMLGGVRHAPQEN